MKLRITATIIASCLLSLATSAQCKKNSAEQNFCVGDTVYTHYDTLARILEFNDFNRPVVVVLEGNEKGEKQIYETDLLYSTKQDCILEFCIGRRVRREDQNDFTREIVGLNKVQNTIMYTNIRNKQYAVRPGQLILMGGYPPASGPTPGPTPTPNPTPVDGTWSADNTINIDGVAQSQVSISSSQSSTALILSCEAPSSDMKLKIKTDVSYNAEVMSVINDPKQLLFVQLIVDSEAIELTSWTIEGPNIIAQTEGLYPDEVSRIKNGNNMKLVILSDTSSESEEEIIIHEQDFSLKGSHGAITSAEKHCSSDVPKI